MGGAADLAVEASSTDLRSSDALGVRVRQALRVAGVEPGGWSGSGAFQGKWRGTLAEPIFQGRFSGQQVGFLGVHVGPRGMDGRRGAGAPAPGAARGAPRRRRAAARGMDGDRACSGSRTPSTCASSFPAGPRPTSPAPWPGTSTCRGRSPARRPCAAAAARPLGAARFASPRGGSPACATRPSRWRPRCGESVTEVTAGAATVAGGRVEFHGTATDDGTYDGEATARGVDVAALAASAGIATAWRGRLSGRAVGFGSLDRPRLTRAHRRRGPRRGRRERGGAGRGSPRHRRRRARGERDARRAASTSR